MFDYLRTVCAVPDLEVGNPYFNSEKIIEKIHEAASENADVVVFPELCVTGFSCGDLFYQQQLLDASDKQLCAVAEATENYDCLVAVGAPIRISGRLYNCAVLMADGVICGIVPKTYVQNYYERCFASADELRVSEINFSAICNCSDDDYSIPVGSNLIFEYKNFVKIGVEICEDLFAPLPESTLLSLNGAEVILNLAASNETAGKREFRYNSVKHQSEKCICAYVFASAGECESTTDLIYSGHSIIAEYGNVVCENDKIIDTDYLIIADVDIGKIKAERMKNTSFSYGTTSYSEMTHAENVAVNSASNKIYGNGDYALVAKSPFIPSDEKEKKQLCMSIFEMQTAALKKRIRITNGKTIIGVSGGLDSTLALLVCINAMKSLGRDAKDVIAITLPCFGTTDRTYNNALKLMELLGVTAKEVNIKEACTLHCKDIGHDINKFDVTFENVQARERTQILMDIACEEGGFVVGTGDLSELALGWCTYNADHMSMYGVNASVPKTLMREIIRSIAQSEDFANCAEVLNDVVATPVSPELLPPDENGRIAQETEDIVGPYILHDFFIYYSMRYGFSPKKIYNLAVRAFEDEFDAPIILKWLKTFYRRFFTQQFKRNCMPDGVKTGCVGFSPRGDWNMPSDASAAAWMRELDEI